MQHLSLDIWSNLAYGFAAVFCVVYIIRSNKTCLLTLFFSSLILLIGFGSGLYHTYETPLAQLSDIIPCWTFMMTYTAAALHHMLKLSRARTLLYMCAFVTTLLVTGTFHLEAPSVPWIPAGVMLWILSYCLYKKNRRSFHCMFTGACCFTFGLTLKAIDPWLVKNLEVGTHWLWHLVTAVMLVYLTTGMHDYFVGMKKEPSVYHTSNVQSTHC